MLPKEPTLDVSMTHLAELVEVFKYEDEEEHTIYLTFITGDQPIPVYIYGSVIPDSSPSDTYNDVIELKYLIGRHFNLSVRATTINGETKYYTDDDVMAKILGTGDKLET